MKTKKLEQKSSEEIRVEVKWTRITPLRNTWPKGDWIICYDSFGNKDVLWRLKGWYIQKDGSKKLFNDGDLWAPWPDPSKGL